MSGTPVHVRHLEVSGADATLVEVSDVTFEPGIPTTIVGESGSGKSLLAHALLGILPSSLRVAGTVEIGDTVHDLSRVSQRVLWGRRLALLPQEPALALDPTMRVRAQVAEGSADFRSKRRNGFAAADAMLTRLGLSHAGPAYPHTLSGGMAQRVAYAAASIGGADVLVVDEPTKGLDTASVDLLAQLLLEHAHRGGSLLTITHDLRLARALAGRVLVMRSATIVERGPADQVLTAPEHPYTRQLVAADPARWPPRTTTAVGNPEQGPPTMVTATGVSKSFSGRVVFEDLDVQIRAGERLALTGQSGAGKTTLGNVIVGVTTPDRGTVTHHKALAPGRVQKLYQDPGLSFPRRVRLELAIRDVCRRHHVPDGRLASLLDRVGLHDGLLARRVDEVSGGELQRLAIVRAMLTAPALVFADEATSRLDLITQQQTMDCLMSELDDTGAALLLVTHDSELATAITGRQIHLDTSTDQEPVLIQG